MTEIFHLYFHFSLILPSDEFLCTLRKCEEIQMEFSTWSTIKKGCLFKLLKCSEKLLCSQYKSEKFFCYLQEHFLCFFFSFFSSWKHWAIWCSSRVLEGARYLGLRLDRIDAPNECRPVLMDVSAFLIPQLNTRTKCSLESTLSRSPLNVLFN